MKKYIITFCLALISSLTLAAQSQGQISAPGVTQWGQALFGMVESDGVSAISGTKPACATSPGWSYWAIDLQTATGRAMYATVLTAHAQGKAIHVDGKNVCDAFGNRESVDWLFILN